MLSLEALAIINLVGLVLVVYRNYNIQKRTSTLEQAYGDMYTILSNYVVANAITHTASKEIQTQLTDKLDQCIERILKLEETDAD